MAAHEDEAVDEVLALNGFSSLTSSTSKRPFCERCNECTPSGPPITCVKTENWVYHKKYSNNWHFTRSNWIYSTRRPRKVCLCEAIPETPVAISTTVYILQHPEEKHRLLTTVPILSACLPSDKCIVYNDIHYSQAKYSKLHELLKSPQTLVLYPDSSATDLRDIVRGASPCQKFNLVVPDGTWHQAKQIYKRNDVLQKARKVQLNENVKSRYVIRTQPTKNSLSTLEAIAVSLSLLERRDEIAEVLMKPLQLLCKIQLGYGAVPHTSKEEKKEQQKLELEKLATDQQKYVTFTTS